MPRPSALGTSYQSALGLGMRLNTKSCQIVEPELSQEVYSNDLGCILSCPPGNLVSEIEGLWWTSSYPGSRYTWQQFSRRNKFTVSKTFPSYIKFGLLPTNILREWLYINGEEYCGIFLYVLQFCILYWHYYSSCSIISILFYAAVNSCSFFFFFFFFIVKSPRIHIKVWQGPPNGAASMYNEVT